MSEKQNISVIEYLNGLNALQLAEDQRVGDKFIEIFNKVHGKSSGAMVYEAEKFHFMNRIANDKDLQQCTRLSLYGAFMDLSIQGLSLDPSRKLAYLMFDNINVGTKTQPVYEKRAKLQISPYGELHLRREYGQILEVDNPEVVFEGEKFTKVTGKDGTIVYHEVVYPRPTTKIIACYIRMVKYNGSIDYFVMDLPMMERLRKASEKKNGGTYPDGTSKANSLYGNATTGPDRGFLEAKTIKHAFRAYPKVKLKGQFSNLQTEEIEDDDEDRIDYYEIEKKDAQPEPKEEVQPKPDPEPKQEKAETPQPQQEQPKKERVLKF